MLRTKRSPPTAMGTKISSTKCPTRHSKLPQTWNARAFVQHTLPTRRTTAMTAIEATSLAVARSKLRYSQIRTFGNDGSTRRNIVYPIPAMPRNNPRLCCLLPMFHL